MAEAKTNAQRIVEQNKIPVKTYAYDPDAAADGAGVAQLIGKPAGVVYKTIVTRGAKGELYVFVVPVEREIDLKKAARAVSEKSIELVRTDELLKLTGYIRGGCSPVGMKKKYRTVIDASARPLPEMTCSAGRRGLQMELAPAALAALSGAEFLDIVERTDSE